MGVALSSVLSNSEHALNNISARTRERLVNIMNLTSLEYRETRGMGIQKKDSWESMVSTTGHNRHLFGLW